MQRDTVHCRLDSVRRAAPPDEELWSKFTRGLPNTLDLRWELQNPSFFMDGAHLSVAGHALWLTKSFDKIRTDLQ